MKTIDLLTSPVATALGWTMLHAVWQGFALVLPTAVALHVLRGRSSVFRYQISVLTLAAQLLVSVATFGWYYQPAIPARQFQTASSVVQTVSIRWQTVAPTLPWHQQVQQFLESHLSQFVLIYLIGVVLFGLRLAGGWLYLQRLSQTATHPTSIMWTELTDRLRASLAIQSVIRVRESARIAVPMVVGVVKPVLLLPIGLATGLNTREIEAILAHELAHVKRHDYAVNLLQSVMEVLYFFHPALWWLSARVREEREHCCDDLAVQACGGDGRALAGALARVEEMRLAQAHTPALAMAFATKRQQLLHRVRRVLGVSSRPVVSNGSLAGLTLATILLVSASVYAVQQDKPRPKPKPKTAQSTRQFNGVTDGNRITFGMSNGRMTYIVFNGKRLPKTRVQRLQQQLDQVMTGSLNLDTVTQPDRDILLTIFEKKVAFDMGMGALSEGLSQIDYDNMTQANVEIIDSVLKNGEWARVANFQSTFNYDSVANAALASLPGVQEASLASMPQATYDSLDRQRAYHQRQMDSLSQLITQRSQQAQALRLQMEKFQFPIEALKREQDILNWRKDKLMEQRNALIEKHHRLLSNNGKQKLSQTEVEKQVEALQPEIKKLEGSMEELNKQFETLNSKEEDAKAPMDKLEQQAQELDEQMERLSEQMSKHGDRMTGFVNHNEFLNLRLNENLNINLNREMNEHRRAADRQLREMRVHLNELKREGRVIRVTPGRSVTPLPAIAPRPPRAIRGQIARPAPVPAAPATPKISGQVTPAAPASPVRPATAPATPSPAPRPDK